MAAFGEMRCRVGCNLGTEAWKLTASQAGQAQRPCIHINLRDSHSESTRSHSTSFFFAVSKMGWNQLGENWGSPGGTGWTEIFAKFEVFVDKPKPPVAAKIGLSVVPIDLAVAVLTMPFWSG